jgi:hypothetical protein
MALTSMWASFVLLAVAVASVASDAEVAAPSASQICIVRYWTEARWRNYGYDHIVHLQNGCRHALRCAVSTDVAPRPVVVSLPSASQREVLTFLGSPARAFSASVACHAKSD